MGRSKVQSDMWPINLTITVEQREWLLERAKIEDRSTSSVVRRILTEERERLEGEGKS